MAALAEIYEWFMTGKKPTQAQFWASWGSFWNKEEKIPQSAVNGLTSVLNAKVENDQFGAHKDDPDAHAESIGGKMDKGTYDGNGSDLDSRILDLELPDRVLKFGDITITGLDVSIADNAFAWVVNRLQFLTPEVFSQTITAATTGMFRTDVVVGNEVGMYDILKGDEAATGAAAAEKAPPEGTIRLGYILLQGNSVIGSGTAPADEKATIVANDRINIDDSENQYNKAAVPFSKFKEEIFKGEIKLTNYPNTRSDGQLPTNKVLSTDASGNVKLYTMAVSPAPYIAELVPDSYLPDTTGNIRIHGDFFTPTMCDRVANPEAIVIGGVATIHYATFVSSQELLVNVTTGSVEGSFPCTLDNGLSTTKGNAFLIVLGTVYKPTPDEWIDVSEPIELSESGQVTLKTPNVTGHATWNRLIDHTKKWRIDMQIEFSPLLTSPTSQGNDKIEIIDVVTGDYYTIAWHKFTINNAVKFFVTKNQVTTISGEAYNSGFFRINSDFVQLYLAGYVGQNTQPLNDFRLKITLQGYDIFNIKYIELVS